MPRRKSKNEELTIIDKTKVFEEEIRPLLNDAMRLCSNNGIPAFYACAAENNEEGTKYLTDMVSAVTNDIHLKDDKLVDFANVLNGFYTVPVRNEESFMLDALPETALGKVDEFDELPPGFNLDV